MRPPFYKSESFWIMIVLLLFYGILVLTNKLEVNENLIVGALAIALFGGAKVALKFFKPGPLAAVVAAIAEEDGKSETEKAVTGYDKKLAEDVKAVVDAVEEKKNDSTSVPHE